MQRARSSFRADWLVLAFLLSFPLAATIWGLPYYLSPLEDRVRSGLHAWLRPSGPVGQSLGVAALAMFLFMWLYPLRKNLRWASRLGSLAGWLRIHVIVGLALPVVAAVHAGWRFEGIVGLGYLAMAIVCLSGIIGRYLYSRIPRHRNGIDMTRSDIEGRRRALVTEMAVALGRMPAEIEHALIATTRSVDRPRPWASLLRPIADDLARRRAIRALRATWCAPRAGRATLDPALLEQALGFANQEIRLRQQAQLLDVTQRIFHYWHVAHRPFAVTALLAIVVHVIVAFLMGQTWLG